MVQRTAVCVECSAEFTAGVSGPLPRQCLSCNPQRGRRPSRPRRELTACRVCKIEFMPFAAGRPPRCCSSCRKRGYGDRRRTKKTDLVWLTCRACDAPFADKRQVNWRSNQEQVCRKCEPTYSVRRCRTCSQDKPLADFNRHPTKRDGIHTQCRTCLSAYKRVLKERDPLIDRKQALWRYYGLSLADYEELLAVQDGVCAICRMPPEPGTNLHVDHDHGCCPGKKTCGNCIRGLLCGDCNLALGCLKDNVDYVSRALLYLTI